MGRREGAGRPSRAGRVVSPHVAGLAPTIGRDTELRDLRTAFDTNRIQVLTGMGGVGKTSLARAYAQRHLADYSIVWWVRAEDPAALDAEFRALLEILLPLGQAAQVRDARTVALAQLATQTDPWLLVLDNVPNAEAAQGLLPPPSNGHVLITSRATAWPAATTIEPLEMDAAVELLTSQSGDADREAAKALTTELGGLPLALAQAAGFARANAISLATYLRLYRDRGAELHKEGRPADYPDTVATTWRLAMDRLSEPAREMLNVFAFYAPDAIPVHRLFSNTDELARHRAIGELRAHSLVTPAELNAVTVHRLVQAVTRDQLGPHVYEWAAKARALMVAAMPEEPVTATSLALWNSLRTHIRALVDRLPPEHPATLSVWHDIANWTGNAGDAAQARDLLAETLPMWERILGYTDPDTLMIRHNLAHWTGYAGDAQRARELFAELLATLERVRGAEHPDSLRAWFNLAAWTDRAGNAERAGDVYAELLPIQERVLGAEHPDTLVIRHNLAGSIGRFGDAERARELFVELLAVRERVLGAEHPDTVSTRHDLATWTGLAEDRFRARDMFAEVHATRERVLGAEHPDTLTTRQYWALWTALAGDWALARDMFAELLPVQERVLGAEHPDTQETRQQLAYWAGLVDRVEKQGPGGGADS